MQVGETLALSGLDEIKLVVPYTDSVQYATGRLYFDNLRVGGFIPKATPVDLSVLGFPHLVKDFSDGLSGNNFFGISAAEGGMGASITQSLSTTNFYTNPALRLDYDVNPEDSFIFYLNTLGLNSEKDKLALYLRSGLRNPGRVKLEFHDSNWISSDFTEGSAFGMLSGLSTRNGNNGLSPSTPTASPSLAVSIRQTFAR